VKLSRRIKRRTVRVPVKERIKSAREYISTGAVSYVTITPVGLEFSSKGQAELFKEWLKKRKDGS